MRTNIFFRLLFSLCAGLFFFSANTQELHTDTVHVSGGTRAARNAVVYLPAGYTPGKAYPLVLYIHGLGQAGTDINKLYQTGLPKVLKDGYRPSLDFIMVAVQSASYSLAPKSLEAILQDVEKRWAIDTARIYLTGIDAGGWAAYGAQLNVGAAFAKKFAAIVTISATTQNVNKQALDWWTASRTPLWSIVGEQDKNYVSQNAVLVDALNQAVPGLATLTLLPGVGHGGWDAVYRGEVKQDGKTVWQWLEAQDRSKTFSKPHVTAPATTITPSLATTATTSTTTLSTTTTKQVKVNVFGGTNPYSNTAWNNWNVGTDNGYSLSSGTFKYSDGTASSISALLSTSRSVGDNSATYGSGMAPAEVLRYASYASTSRTLTISGLNATKTYDIELYASRGDNEGNSTVFTVNGIAKTITTYNNLTNKAIFSDLTPNSAKQLLITINSANTFNYLNGFTITENTEATTVPTPSVTPSGITRIEGEDYTGMYGVETQPTTDVGGGENVGWIDNGDWMDYSINVSTAGTYAVKMRVAAPADGGKFQIKNGSGTVLATVTVPNTGDFQAWRDITTSITLAAGTQTLRLQSVAATAWNLNWYELTGAADSEINDSETGGRAFYTGTYIEAEQYTARSGISFQTTRDFAGGVQNTFDTDYGDWISYTVNAPAAGPYTLSFRLACDDLAGSRFQIKNGSGTVLTTVTVPNTNSWQVWRDVTAVVTLAAGTQTLKLQSVSTIGWNMNYFECVKTPLNAFASYTLRPNSGTSIYLPQGLNLAHLKGGDTLTIPGGTYNVIELGNFRGTATNPVIIRNRNGQVTCKIIRLSNTPEYFKLLGNGDPNVKYGFKINGNYTTGSCLTAFGKGFEIAYIEGMQSKSGFFIKKNPTADDPESQHPNYLMDDIHIHHNYLHDITGEGMYIGHTGADGGQGGNMLLPVRMRNVEIAYNKVERTGWDGIQLANATTGNKIHHNTVLNFGTANQYGQQMGILLGRNSQADIYDNVIKFGTGNAIQNFGFGLNKIYNNYMEKVGRNGTDRGYEAVFCNDIVVKSEVRPKQQIQAYNNTILYPMPWGAIRVSGYNQNSLPATMQYNKVLLPNAPSNWEKLYFPTYVPNSIISGNTLITQ